MGDDGDNITHEMKIMREQFVPQMFNLYAMV